MKLNELFNRFDQLEEDSKRILVDPVKAPITRAKKAVEIENPVERGEEANRGENDEPIDAVNIGPYADEDERESTPETIEFIAPAERASRGKSVNEKSVDEMTNEEITQLYREQSSIIAKRAAAMGAIVDGGISESLPPEIDHKMMRKMAGIDSKNQPAQSKPTPPQSVKREEKTNNQFDSSKMEIMKIMAGG